MSFLEKQQQRRHPGNDVLHGQGEHHTEGHELIRQRVHQLAEIRDQIVFPGDLPVKEIRDGGNEIAAGRRNERTIQ